MTLLIIGWLVLMLAAAVVGVAPLAIQVWRIHREFVRRLASKAWAAWLEGSAAISATAGFPLPIPDERKDQTR